MTESRTFPEYIYIPGVRFPVLRYELRAVAGASVDDVATALVEQVKHWEKPITVFFNETPMYARPGMTAEQIVANWDRRRRAK